MKVNVLLFAAARDAAAADSIQLELPEGASAGQLLETLGQLLPSLAPLLPACRLAIDQSYVARTAVIRPDAEIALIPPVSGG